MKLADFVVAEAIISDLRATTKVGAIHEMVSASRASGCIGAADVVDVVRAILSREELGTTGFGQIGVAFPEARHWAGGQTLGTIALSRGVVVFDATDGGLVQILFLVVSPPNQPANFLRAEEMISALVLGVEDFRKRLRRAGTREEILAEADRDSL
jgi:mannitol/fructose-specific phosphotransferase system IIA component (Ntr-type)